MSVTKSELINSISDDLLHNMCSRLYEFYYNFVAIDYAEETDGRHLQVLAEKLEQVTQGTIRNLCVAMPPRHSKSSMVTLAYPIWLLSQNNDLRILIVNATGTLSENFGIRLRDYIEDYGSLFGLYLSGVKHAKDHLKFENSKGELLQGQILLAGADSQISGQDADYIILDDIYSGFDDITPSLLAKKIEWYKTIIEQRIEPHTKLVILHTRWHSEDLQGYLHEHYPDDYTFLEFPAINDEGQPLWPQRYTLDEYDKKRETMGERLFQAIYQQQPIDMTSNFFKIEHIQWNQPLTDYDKVCRAWDIASSDNLQGDKNDSTCGIKAYKHNDKFYITDMVHGQFGERTKDTIKNQTIIDDVEVHQVIETGVAAAGKLLFQEWQDQLEGYIVEQATPVKSKVDRATPLQNAVYDKKVIVNLSDANRDRFIQEFRSFPNGKHDDIVDAVAHAYNYLFKQEKKPTPQLGVVYL
jgi:predicted phage terminase large subunit-like protein